MGSRPCQRLGDLGRSRFSSNHRQIRNPHQHLKIRRNDVEMRRPVIVGVDTDADGAKALQCRHTNASINSATIALLRKMSRTDCRQAGLSAGKALPRPARRDVRQSGPALLIVRTMCALLSDLWHSSPSSARAARSINVRLGSTMISPFLSPCWPGPLSICIWTPWRICRGRKG